MTNSLLKSCRKKSRLLKAYNKTGTSMARNRYIKYKNILKQALRHEEKKFYENQFMIKANDARKTWKLINSLINKDTKSNMSHIFKINNQVTNDKNVIVNMFNKYFVEIGPHLADKIPPSKNTQLLKGITSNKNSMVIGPTDHREVENIISSLKNTSSCGVDHIPVTAIKAVSEYISPMLASLINHSIDKGIFPDALKIAKILPIYKSGDRSSITNYRPISLLNTFSKIYEKVILNRLDDFLNKHKILYEGQFGFRKNHSTQLAIISYLDHITAALDKNEHSISLFIDLSKAFDTINHNILLKKLDSYGIRGLANDLIKNYLINRSQFVELDGVSSDYLGINCGVPQGSILGPILFLLYVNDMYTCAKLLKFFLFADDTTIVFSSSDINCLINTVNAELVHLTDWFALNKLSLNISKTNYMIFKNSNIESFKNDLFLNGEVLTRVHTVKFLGVQIDDKLSWKNHTDMIGKKLSSAIFIIRRIRYKINQKTAQNLYNTLILPHITYCNVVWGNAYKSYTSNIGRLQKRALRLCYNGRLLKSDELFSATKKLSLENIHKMQVALLVFNFFYNPCLLPACINSLFEKISEVHGHHTRSLDNKCLFTHFGRLNARKNSLKILAPTLWNNIPPPIRHLSSVILFKKQYTLFLQVNL